MWNIHKIYVVAVWYGLKVGIDPIFFPNWTEDNLKFYKSQIIEAIPTGILRGKKLLSVFKVVTALKTCITTIAPSNPQPFPAASTDSETPQGQ